MGSGCSRFVLLLIGVAPGVNAVKARWVRGGAKARLGRGLIIAATSSDNGPMRAFFLPGRWDLRVGTPAFYAAALAVLFAAYLAVLALTSLSSLPRLIGNAFANVLSM